MLETVISNPNLSTNPSIEDLRAVVNGTTPAAPAAPPAPPVETPVAPPVTAPAAPVAAGAEPPAPPVPEDKKPKRFSDLTRRAQEAEARANALAREMATLKAAPPAPTVTAPTAPTAPQSDEITDLPGKPTPPDDGKWTGTWDELNAAKSKFTSDMIAWGVKNERNKEKLTDARNAELASRQQVDTTWKEKYNAAIEEDGAFEGIVKVVGAALKVHPGIAEVIKESDIAADILRHLHDTPDALAKLTKMSIASAARTIGVIEKSIIDKKAAPPAPPLPPPPPQIGGGASGNSTDNQPDPSKMSIDELRIHVNKTKTGNVGLAATRRKVL